MALFCAFLVAFSCSSIACGPTWPGSIGAVLGKDNHSGRMFVREVPPGQGAFKAGLVEGDEIVKIAGEPVDGMSPGDVQKRLRGEVGSKVRVTVIHDGVTHEVVVERSPLDEP